MPGFTNKTGGLIIDEEWLNLDERNSDGPVLIFTYEREWKNLVFALESFLGKSGDSDKQILVAQGRGLESFKNCAQNHLDKNLKVLNFMNQTEWDKMMKSCSALVIRGEESMSRACLSGLPFIWHAYPQSDEYQLVKVKALLSKLKPYFSDSDYQIIEKAWLAINVPYEETKSDEEYKNFNDFFQNLENLAKGFKQFSLDLRKNGDLCSNLMTFIEKIIIINK